MYTVVWSDEARDGLADAWLRADSAARSLITAAAQEMDKYLRANGPRVGESRDEDLRLVTAGPLGIEFRVSEMDRRVTVVRAWTIRPRR